MSTNGEGSIGHQVAALLIEAAERSRECATALVANALQMDGLARVLLRDVPFAAEHRDGIAAVVQASGDAHHREGSERYELARKIREVA